MPEIQQSDPCFLSVNNGPLVRKSLMDKAEEEYNNGNVNNSIYYQVRALYGIMQDRYFNRSANKKFPLDVKVDDNTDFDDPLLQIVQKVVENNLDKHNDDNAASFVSSCNFLHNIYDPAIGFNKIIEICKEFPSEWTILQICKGPRPQTTYSVFKEIHEREADIYLTILRHARSNEYPEPICIRFSDIMQIKIFESFSKISSLCKEYMQVKSEDVTTHEAKVQYWSNLKKLDQMIIELISDLKSYIFPFVYIFHGIPTVYRTTGSKKYQKESFAAIDELCDSLKLKQQDRILLSMAALQITHLTSIEIEAIATELSDQLKIQSAIKELLQKLQTKLALSKKMANSEYTLTNFPCILIVDEHLDHFYWEELNIEQEFCRVNSLHCLWKLFDAYKHRIEKGYLKVNVKKGACIINPDNSLVKTEMRMGAFFKYWTPSWLMKFGEKPTQESIDDFFKSDCYFYCGHGSGFQHISGRRISKQKIEAIVFLFGCDSTRMSSSGLFSDLIGSHFYYHAALCPTLVGTLLPALDAKMDEISVEIISRWVAPDSKSTLKWENINKNSWSKKGVIEPIEKPKKEVEQTENYNIGSLCGALARIHASREERNFYNTVSYVCRGLPAWNCGVQPLPN